jgi:hypothetical protein
MRRKHPRTRRAAHKAPCIELHERCSAQEPVVGGSGRLVARESLHG